MERELKGKGGEGEGSNLRERRRRRAAWVRQALFLREGIASLRASECKRGAGVMLQAVRGSAGCFPEVLWR